MTQTGQPGPFYAGETWTWDVRAGHQTIFTHVGTAAEIDGLAATYQTAGYKLRRTKTPGQPDRLEVSADVALDGSSTTADAALSVDWELDGSDYEISIYKQMILRGVPDHLATEIESWVSVLKGGTGFSLADAIAGVRYEATISPTFDADTAEEWLKLVKSGVESHRVSNFVLRKTIAAPNAWTNSATANIGKLYTKAQIQSENTGVFAIPSGVAVDMPSTGYWLKGTPRRRTMGNGKIQWSQEWQHADTFSTLQYDLVT